ncbi:MAG: carbon monoxide dehydrogenase subunit [Nocardioides sp.]|nr:carbon monoxide dehydrogenase subunit [Nocardioides sp.]
MKLDHSFVVPIDLETAWKTLTDVERVAPCMPGATLLSVDGDTFSGEVRVKLGPIGLKYAMTASFLEQDVEIRRATIEARGKEKRGSGTAAARITLQLHPRTDNQTNAEVSIDLDITGRPAQFGRSTLSDVSAAIVTDFAARLATMLSESPDTAVSTPPGRPNTGADAPVGPVGPVQPDSAVNLTRIALVPILRRAAVPTLAVLATTTLLWRLLSRRRR